MYLVKQIKDTIIDILLRVQGVTKVVDIKYAIKLSYVQAQEKRFVCRPANMAIRVVEFSNEVYIIRKIFA